MAEDAECGINLIAERCGSQLRQVLRNYVNRLEHDIGCHNGSFSFSLFSRILSASFLFCTVVSCLGLTRNIQPCNRLLNAVTCRPTEKIPRCKVYNKSVYYTRDVFLNILSCRLH